MFKKNLIVSSNTTKIWQFLILISFEDLLFCTNYNPNNNYL